MTYVFVEIFLLIAWLVVVIPRLRSRSLAATEDLLVLLLALPFAVLAETVNLYLTGDIGLYYPRSLLFFPGIHFPVAILFSSSLYVWLVHIAARWLSSRAASQEKGVAQVLYFVFFLAMLWSFFIPEDLGVRIGYWKWHVTLPSKPIVWIATYIFYFCFAFPNVVIARFITWRIGKFHMRADSSPPAARTSG